MNQLGGYWWNVCVCARAHARAKALKGTEEVKSLPGILNFEWLMNSIRQKT